MSHIKQLRAREILDSRACPALQVDVELCNGIIGRANVPSGASTGDGEAYELRDKDMNRYQGMGMLRAVRHVRERLSKVLEGMDCDDQRRIDKTMNALDGTSNKRQLGANAILGISLAAARAAANAQKLPFYAYLRKLWQQHRPSADMNDFTLPMPMANILNGGLHAEGTVDLQEFMIMPLKAPSFHEALRSMVEIFHALRQILQKKGYLALVGDEGGFAPQLRSNEEALDMLLEAITQAGYGPGKDIALTLDAAATELYKHAKKPGHYSFWKSSQKELSSEEMVSYWVDRVRQYPQIVSIEDAMHENDWTGWQALSTQLGHKVQLVGDDLFVTQKERLKKGIQDHICNAILIKPNQVGTLTETFETISLAKQKGYTVIISHRSGETEDTMIADLAVAVNAPQIKTGSVCRTDRTAKYNRLLLIEEQLRALPSSNKATETLTPFHHKQKA